MNEIDNGWTAIRHWIIRGNYFDSMAERSVYIVLVDHADNNNLCYPSINLIAKEAMCTRKTVTTTLRTLEEKGLISKENRVSENGAYASNMYHITQEPRQVRELREKTADKTVYQASEQTNTVNPEPEPKPTVEPAQSEPIEEEYPAEFAALWAVYPKHVAKKQALKAWKTARKKTNSAFLLARVQMFATQSAHTETKYIPNLATWLNGERWNDEYRPDPPKQRKPQTNAERNMQTLAASMNQTDIFGFELEAPKPDYPEF